ncbi:MAG: hypothetical protein WCG05_02465 [Alphaproteobacteria bacterium]
MTNKNSLLFSIFFHLLIILILFAPWSMPQKDWEMAKPIPVRIAPIDELTQSPPPKTEENFNKFKEITTQETAKSAPVKEKTPPKKTEIEKKETKVAPVKKEQKKDIKKPVETVSAPPKPQAVKKPEPQAKPLDKKHQETFDSLMKSLERNVESKPAVQNSDPKAFEAENISDKLTLSELDALRQQIQQCWHIQQSVWEDPQMVVEATVDIGPDRKVTNISIKRPKFGTNRAAFQAAVDSVKQALAAPECTPLALPEGKHDQWKRAKFVFSPKGVI